MERWEELTLHSLSHILARRLLLHHSKTIAFV